jgi:3alpha(or 20beta)-hydroxysteroid dehydrogenase
MGRLNGKVALITGGAMGLGEANARKFVEEGARVVITDLATEQGNALASELGNSALFLPHDVSDLSQWDDVVAKAMQKFGSIDVLVNNAGVAGPYANLLDLPVDDFLKIMAVNVNGVFFGMRSVIPVMLKGGSGSVVNISSVAGYQHRDNSTNGAYTASKFAVRGLTKAASVEFAQFGVRVNSVHPGGVLTPMSKANTPQDVIDKFAAALPIRRLGEPEEIANLVLFLASDESSYMTGAECVADGGMLH